MWIVANGAHKSGSTWIFQLVNACGRMSPFPRQFQNPDWQNPSADRSKVHAAAKTLSQASEYYVSKQHWPNEHADLMALPGVKVINIIRDIRDVIVSRYHHDVRTFGYKKDIAAFLDERMVELVAENVHYHRYWIGAETVRPESYHVTSYEYLLGDYEKACRELFGYCEIEIEPAAFTRVLEKNLFQNKPRTGLGEFFRKGRAFSFEDDLTATQADRILARAKAEGLAEAKSRIAKHNPSISEWLARTDLGLEPHGA